MKKAVTSAVSAQRRESSDFELQFWSVTGFGRVRPRTSCVPFFRESVESEARVVASRHYRKRQRVDQSDQTPSPANACLYAHKLVDDPTALLQQRRNQTLYTTAITLLLRRRLLLLLLLPLRLRLCPDQSRIPTKQVYMYRRLNSSKGGSSGPGPHPRVFGLLCLVQVYEFRGG